MPDVIYEMCGEEEIVMTRISTTTAAVGTR